MRVPSRTRRASTDSEISGWQTKARTSRVIGSERKGKVGDRSLISEPAASSLDTGAPEGPPPDGVIRVPGRKRRTSLDGVVDSGTPASERDALLLYGLATRNLREPSELLPAALHSPAAQSFGLRREESPHTMRVWDAYLRLTRAAAVSLGDLRQEKRRAIRTIEVPQRRLVTSAKRPPDRDQLRPETTRNAARKRARPPPTKPAHSPPAEAMEPDDSKVFFLTSCSPIM